MISIVNIRQVLTRITSGRAPFRAGILVVPSSQARQNQVSQARKLLVMDVYNLRAVGHCCCRLGVLSSEPSMEFLNLAQPFLSEFLILSLVG